MTKPGPTKRDIKREEEIARGQEIGARAWIQQRFDPDYVPNEGISPSLRAQRDEYRRRMQAQVRDRE